MFDTWNPFEHGKLDRTVYVQNETYDDWCRIYWYLWINNLDAVTAFRLLLTIESRISQTTEYYIRLYLNTNKIMKYISY